MTKPGGPGGGLAKDHIFSHFFLNPSLIKNYVFRIPIGITRMGGLLCCSSKNKSWNTEVLRENGAEVELAGVTWDLGIPEER